MKSFFKQLKTLRYGVLLSMFCILLTGISFSAKADMIKTRGATIKVGYMDYKGFIDKQIDGTYSGYGVEYLSEIARYTDYKYDYIFDTWPVLLDKLKKGQIDFICTAQKTPERLEDYDFSEYPIGYSQGLLYGTADSKYNYEDFTTFNGMKIGIIKNSAMKPLFEKYEEGNGFKAELVELDTDEIMIDQLNEGKLDAIISEHLANHTGMTLLSEFGADAFYVMSYKGSPYMDDVNYALQEIKTDVDFEADLFHKYYDDSTAATSLTFTNAEKEFIETSEPIRVGLNQARDPFATYDKKTNTFSGINVDILNKISEDSGLKFEFVVMDPKLKVPELFATGNFDLICGIERNNFTTNTEIEPTNAYLESAIVPVAKAGHAVSLSDNITAAIPRSFSALEKKLSADFPNIKIDTYNSNKDCLQAVLAGKADVFIQNTHILSDLLQEPRYEKLQILPIQVMTEHTAMAVPRTFDPRLVSILNKSIARIDKGTVDTSLIEHTFANPYQYSLSDFIYKFRTQLIFFAILVSCIVGGLLFLVGIRQKYARYLEDQNKLLVDAVNQADEANASKSRFLSQMSHEIRTPMNAIVGLTSIARHHVDDPEKTTEYLGKIDTSSRVLLNIINDVLDMSAIESNKLKISTSEFDIKQILNEISTIYFPQCEAKGIQFKMATDLNDEVYEGDSLRINQILMNLVSNAFKFTDEGGTIEINVKETTSKDKTAFVRFVVSDTGCGMTEEMQERLFHPFEQENAETARKHGGSGLGLSIAKNLVDMMHGAITVESKKDVGTTFSVDLPLRIVKNRKTMQSDSLSKLRVLTVDDDSASREYSSIVLKRLGINFDAAGSGEEAITMVSEAIKQGRSYDVCLVDWKMPDMDGVEVTRRIRALEGKKTMIVIVSAYDINEMMDEAKAAGVDHFVTKPLFQSTLFNTFVTLTDGKVSIESAKAESYDFTGHKILYAEDNAINAEIAAELFKMVNLNCDHVINGKKAVEAFEEAPEGTYDLILMDIQMPVMDGYEASRTIRALSRSDAKTIPIFALTANAFAEDVSSSLSAGMNGHISKPIDTKVLYDTIKANLKDKK